jgi:nitrite reductase/ring-hydroxylating ferredoxin subunit
MSLVKIGPVNAFPGGVRQVSANGRVIAICRVGDALHAVDGICPHAGGPLAQGALHGSTLVCPFHAWEFDCITGEYDRNPDLRLQTFRVIVENGDVFVDA